MIDEIEVGLDSCAYDASFFIKLMKKNSAVLKAHPLGFISCVLFHEGKRKLRVHLWPTCDKFKQDDSTSIHDHIFSFKSWILKGSILNIIYEENKSGEVYNKFLTRYEKDQSIIFNTNEFVKITEKERNIYNYQQSYEVSHGILHESRLVSSESAMTVLITEDIAINEAIVLSKSSNEKFVYNRLALSESEKKKLLCDFI